MSKTVHPGRSTSSPPPSRNPQNSEHRQKSAKSHTTNTATLTERQKETKQQLERIRIEDQSRMEASDERMELDSTMIAPLKLDTEPEEEDISDLQELAASEHDFLHKRYCAREEPQLCSQTADSSSSLSEADEIPTYDVSTTSLYQERRVSETSYITHTSQMTCRTPEKVQSPLPKNPPNEPESDIPQSKAASLIPCSLRAGPRPESQSSFADLDRIVRHGSRKEIFPPR